jgi:hypothetical protein
VLDQGYQAEFQQAFVVAMAALVMAALALLVLVLATVVLVMLVLALLVLVMVALLQKAGSLRQEWSERSWEPQPQLLSQQRPPRWTAFETSLDDSVFASSFFAVNEYEQGSMYRCCKNKRSIFW